MPTGNTATLIGAPLVGLGGPDYLALGIAKSACKWMQAMFLFLNILIHIAMLGGP